MSARPAPSRGAGAVARNGWIRALATRGCARPLIIAHRGDSFHAPENTLEAAVRGHAAGADAWELDVHLTRDGVPVVIHDESLLRTTNVARRFAGDPRGAHAFLVADFDLDEIQALDAGSWFLDPGGALRTAAGFGTKCQLAGDDCALYASGEVCIPTLAQALALTDELDWLVNVELKSFPNRNHALVDAVLAVIDQTGTANRVLVSSFDHADVARSARREGPGALERGLVTGVLTATPLYRPEHYVRDHVGATAYHPSADALGAGAAAYLRAPSPRTLRHDALEALKAHAVPVLVYTVNDAAADGLAVHLAAAGVDGLFSDDPAALAERFGTPARPVFGAARTRSTPARF